MREYKFRGMCANGTMRYGRLSQDKPNSTVYYKEYSQRICWDDSNIPVKNSTLGQYTGLKDNTRWEQLAEEEKQEFYNQHKSEDGRSIKYQNINDVEHLWNGKEIYEGDILKGPNKFRGIVEFEDGAFTIRKNLLYYQREPMGLEVIGNIYENPELLK